MSIQPLSTPRPPTPVRTSINAARTAWTLRSRWSVAVVLVSLALMNVTPVLTSLGAPLALLAVVVAVFDPFAAFLFVAATQISPDAPGFPLTLAQLFVAAWVVTLPINGCLAGLSAIRTGMRYVLVFIVVWTAIGVANETLDETLVYAFITSAILCTYLPRAQGQYRLLLWMLALRSGLGIFGHWGTSLGLPMEGEVYDHLYRGGIRKGSGRGDVNLASMSVGFALWTMVALLLPAAWLGRGAWRKWSFGALIAIVVLMAVPLIAMGSRGGLGYLALGGLAVLLYAFNVRALSGKALSYSLIGCGLLLALAPVAWPVFLDTTPGRMLLATIEFNREQTSELGGSDLAAGRTEIWGKFFQIAMDYPLSGAPKGAMVDMGEYGIAVIGENYESGAGKGGTGHNFLLDLAASRGFPTTILFVIAFAAPVIHLIRRRGALYAQPFVIAHIMVMLAFLNLSVLNWKTFWALHVITALAAARPAARPMDGRSRRAVP